MAGKLRYEELEQKVKELEEEAVRCKRAEKDLIEAKELLEHLIAADPAVVYRCEPRGDYPATFISKNITTQLGYEPEDLTGNPQFWSNHIHPEDKPRVFSELSSLFEEGHHTHEYRFLHKDGTYRWMYDRLNLVRDSKGNPKDIIGSWIDVTDRKFAEEALRAERDNLTNILNSMQDGVYIVNQEHDIEYVNPALTKDFGPFEGRKCYEYFHERNEPCPWCKNKDVFAGKTVRWEWYSFKNQKTYDLLDTPLKNPDGSISKLEIFRDITDIKQSEKAVRESEERFRTLFEGAAEGILVADVETKEFMYANPAICVMLGYTEEELKRMSVVDIHPKEALEHVISEFEAQAQGEKALAHYIPCLRKDGTTIYTDINTAKALIDGKGCNVGFFTDITERKRAEEELSEKERFLKSVFDAIQDGISVRDRDLNIVQVNRWMETKYATHMPLIGKKCYAVFQQRESPCPWCPAIPAMETGEPQRQVVPYPSAEKPAGWLELTAFPLNDAEGHVTGAIEHVKDITERKQAEEALKDSEQEKQAILNSMSEVVVYQDLEHKVVWANRVAGESIGVAPDELLGRPCYEMWHEGRKPCEGCPVAKARETGQPKEREMTTPDGRVWFVRAYPVRDTNGDVAGVVEVTGEITERKRAEEALRESQGKLNAMLKSIGEHMSMMDKDLNILWANETAKSTFGKDIIGKKCYEVYHGRKEPCEPYPCLTLKVFRDGRIHEHDRQVIDKDGKVVYFHCTANVALKDKDGKPTAVLEISRDITERQQREQALREKDKELEVKATSLEEVNTALKVLLKQREEDRSDLEEKVLSNVKQLVSPHLQRLKKSGLDTNQRSLVSILESNLDNIVSSFTSKLSSKSVGLTPMEIRIADLVKEGKTNKEIGEILCLSPNTVKFHRYNLRNKLGLKNKKINLRSHLLSLVK